MNSLLHRLYIDAPFVSDGALAALITHLDFQAAEHPFYKELREKMRPQMSVADGIASIPVEGVLARKPDVHELFYGVEDTSQVLSMVESATADRSVKGILLNVDSPGGFLTGGPEVADAIREAGKSKPVVAWTGGMMASLAYWIGSQATEVVASRSAQVGSIGVFTTHVDYSQMLEKAGIKVEVIKNKEADFKAAGAMGACLSDEQRTHIQGRIQASFDEFKRSVQSARPQAKDGSMRGQVFTGVQAKAAGLVDRVGDQSYATSILRSLIRSRGN